MILGFILYIITQETHCVNHNTVIEDHIDAIRFKSEFFKIPLSVMASPAWIWHHVTTFSILGTQRCASYSWGFSWIQNLQLCLFPFSSYLNQWFLNERCRWRNKFSGVYVQARKSWQRRRLSNFNSQTSSFRIHMWCLIVEHDIQ